MADNAGNPAAPVTPAPAPSGAGPGNPGGFGVPEGYILARKDEVDTYRRQSDQYNGVKPYYERGAKLGIKSAEDFDRYAPVFETLTKRGIDPKRFAAMFTDDAEKDLGGNKDGAPRFDPAEFEKAQDAKWERKLAEREWSDLTKREKEHVDAALRDFLGDAEVDELTKAGYRAMANNFMNDNRELYPEGHPLRKDLPQPFNESLAKKAVEYLKAEKARYAGAAMANKADAVIASDKKPSSSAGKGGGNGPPTKKPSRSDGMPDPEVVEAAYKAKLAARAAGGR